MLRAAKRRSERVTCALLKGLGKGRQAGLSGPGATYPRGLKARESSDGVGPVGDAKEGHRAGGAALRTGDRVARSRLGEEARLRLAALAIAVAIPVVTFALNSTSGHRAAGGPLRQASAPLAVAAPAPSSSGAKPSTPGATARKPISSRPRKGGQANGIRVVRQTEQPASGATAPRAASTISAATATPAGGVVSTGTVGAGSTATAGGGGSIPSGGGTSSGSSTGTGAGATTGTGTGTVSGGTGTVSGGDTGTGTVSGGG